jgi:hypothetical protein
MMRYLLTMLLCLSLPAAGLCGGAVNFDGVNDYIDLGDFMRFDNTDFTVSTWVKYSGIGDGQIIAKDRSTITEKREWGVSVVSGDMRTYTFRAGATPGYTWTVGGDINDGQWHQVVFTYSPVSLKNQIYIDGIFRNESVALSSAMSDTPTSVTIGARVVNNYNFNGAIDEVLIYNVALTTSEIQAMYASTGAWYPKRGLVSRWSMENNGKSTGQAHANGSTIKDSAGSNNGTISDGANNSMTLIASPLRTKRGRR